MTVRIITAHVLEGLAQLADESVHCVVCSPPYYGLRDYGIEPQVWAPRHKRISIMPGGDCQNGHDWGEIERSKKGDRKPKNGFASNDELGASEYAQGGAPLNGGNFCLHCNAWRGSLGLEPTLDLYLDHMVEVFREVRRVLRKDGTCWLNIGDSYRSSPAGNKTSFMFPHQDQPTGQYKLDNYRRDLKRDFGNFKPKDLMLIPSRLAIRLQEDGWWVRSDIIFAKRAPMPESARDRPTSAHEHVFLLTKSPRYYFDGIALSQAIINDDENLHEMFGREGGGSVPAREEGQERSFVEMPSVSRSEGEGVSRHPRGSRVLTETSTTLQRFNARESQASGIQSVAESQGIEGSVATKRCRQGQCGSPSQDRETQSDTPQILPEREGASGNRSVSGDAKGSRIAGARSSQAPRQNGNSEHRNLRRMGEDQRASAAQMSLLPANDAKTDDGSCDSDQQGRSSRGVEHRPGVSELQREEKQQDSASDLTNARNVWWLGPDPFPLAHFATFPKELPRRAILAGTSERGVCPKCGAQWERQTRVDYSPHWKGGTVGNTRKIVTDDLVRHAGREHDQRLSKDVETIGWRPTCPCDAGDPVSSTVCDPFFGAGTTGLVADQLGRNCIGIELSPQYAAMAERRLRDDAGMFAEIAAE